MFSFQHDLLASLQDFSHCFPVYKLSLCHYGFCTHPNCTYSSNSLFNLHSHMASCRGRLQVHGAGVTSTVHEVHERRAVQQWSTGSARSCMYAEPESVLSYRSDGTSQIETMDAGLNLAFLIMELLNGGARHYAKPVFELAYRENMNITVSWNNLKNVTSYSKLVRESSKRLLGAKQFTKKSSNAFTVRTST